MKNKLVNILIRIVQLISRLVLLFILAKYLDPEEFALYGLLVASVAYAAYPVGMDFYVYSSRELLRQPDKNKWGGMIKAQIVLHVILYIIFIPIYLLIYYFDILPISLIKWFFLLLVSEHLGQELYRFNVADSRPIFAGWLNLLRSGLWIYVVVFYVLLVDGNIDLTFIMLSWVISSYIALAIGIMRLRKSEYEGWTDTVNWGWLGRGVVVIFPFLLSTLALRGLSTFDRYWFEKLNGLDILAAYIFTTTLLNSLISIHEAAVISFAYPRLIKAHVDGDALEFKKLMSSMLAATVVISVLYCGGLILVLPYLLKLVNHSEYLDNLQMVILIVISALLNIFGLIPHYALYAQGFDKSINISHGLGLLFFILSAIALSQFYTAIAIPLSLCIGFSTILFVNFYAFLKLSPAKYLTNCAHEI